MSDEIKVADERLTAQDSAATVSADEPEFSLDDIDFDMLEQIAGGIDNPAENLSKVEALHEPDKVLTDKHDDKAD